LQTNRYLTQREPWKEQDLYRRAATVALARESLRISAILLQPFLPVKAPSILDWLGVPVMNRNLIWASFGAVQTTGGQVATPNQRLFEAIR
jgi:methionyl-tRNA synthetase